MLNNGLLEVPVSERAPELQTQYFQRPEGTLAYTDYGGRGELVLMLPGMGSLRSEYRYLAPELHDAGYRAVTMDLRGQGDTSVPWKSYDVPSVGKDILALVEQLNAGPAHIIANSYSPAPAIWAAVERPEFIRSLVLISTFASEPKPNLFMKAMSWFMLNNPWRVPDLAHILSQPVSNAQTGGSRGLPGSSHGKSFTAGTFRSRKGVPKRSSPPLGGAPAEGECACAGGDGFERPRFPRPEGGGALPGGENRRRAGFDRGGGSLSADRNA